MTELIQPIKKNNKAIWVLSFFVLGFFAIVAFWGFIITTIFTSTNVVINGETKTMFKLNGVSSDLFVLVPHVMSILIIVTGLLIFMFIIKTLIKHADPLAKPKGLLLIIEIFVTMIDKFTVDTLGEKLKSFAPYIGLLGMYLFTSNVFGLLGFTPPPTANLSVTFTFGLTTFVLIRFYGIKYQKWEHVKGLFRPVLLSPVNIIGELAIPFSLSIRLFGNILSGAIIMTLVYGGASLGFNALISFIAHWLFNVSINISAYTELLAPFTFIIPLMHVYFDLFAGLIQTFVFILLTSVFISNASAE